MDVDYGTLSLLWFGLVIALFGYILHRIKPDNADEIKLCTTCGTSSKPAVIKRGNIIISIILWLCALVPGLIYSIWRASSKYLACPSCGGVNLIPLNSPFAQERATPAAFGPLK